MSLIDDDDSDRDGRRETTALLSRREQRYLRDGGHIEPNSANERAIRSSIRRKLVYLFYDLNIIVGNIEDRDVVQVQEKIRDDADTAYDAINQFAKRFLEDAITAQRTNRIIIDTPDDELAERLTETIDTIDRESE